MARRSAEPSRLRTEQPGQEAPGVAYGSMAGMSSSSTTSGTGLSSERTALATDVIRALAGPKAALRDDQLRAVAALCDPGARVLVVQATGWGKSAVYWAATRIRRAEGGGMTLVVSPLLSLMRDQVRAAERAGLRAATVNSANVEEWDAVLAQVRADEYDVLLVSPERLANPRFADQVLSTLAGRLGLLVIDEAHAVSDWGHDFRPDYRRVADVLRSLDPATPVLATTATANARVTRDLAEQLGAATVVLRGPLTRSSLQLVSLPRMSPLDRYAWVAQHLTALPGSGIVYCLTVADAERLGALLADWHDPGQVAVYTSKLEADGRRVVEQRLLDNDVKVVVATSALGMGFDKPDLGFVVHLGAPPSPVAYYQQVGRAGRGLDHALVVLAPSEVDEPVWEHFATATVPVPEHVDKVLAALADEVEPVSVPALEAATGVRRGRVELMLKQLAVDEVVRRTPGGWEATGRPWTYPREHYAGVVAARRAEADIMRAYIDADDCLMLLLARALDDERAGPCGRCSACRGELPAGLSPRPDAEAVDRVASALRAERHVVAPRKMWPGGAWGGRGRIAAAQQAAEGRAVVFADAPAWTEAVARSFATDTAVQDLLDGAVATLTDWRREWPARPTVVVALAAAGHSGVTTQVAQHLGGVGRLPVLAWRCSDRVAEGEAAGGEEAAAWRDALGDPARALDGTVSGEVVLLVVDRTSTLWPVTVATAALAEAGAAAVLPLVVHRLP
jgi:ATP-dependent DNA helicase RecQ